MLPSIKLCLPNAVRQPTSLLPLSALRENLTNPRFYWVFCEGGCWVRAMAGPVGSSGSRCSQGFQGDRRPLRRGRIRPATGAGAPLGGRGRGDRVASRQPVTPGSETSKHGPLERSRKPWIAAQLSSNQGVPRVLRRSQYIVDATFLSRKSLPVPSNVGPYAPKTSGPQR